LLGSALNLLLGQFPYQRRDLEDPPRAHIRKRNFRPAFTAQHSHISKHPELKLIRHKVDLYLCAAPQINQGCFDIAARYAQVQNSRAKEQPSVRQKDLGISIARIARMAPLFAPLLARKKGWF